MKVLNEEYGEVPIYDWLILQLEIFHEEKYGEQCVIYNSRNIE